jgi:hypothetical protein
MGTPSRTGDRPSWLSRTLIAVAMRLLPRGVVRDRYRRELWADLTVLSQGQRLSFALRSLASAPALRRATKVASTSAGRDVMARPRKPFLCRTGLHHRWELASTGDGEEFVRCERCLKERGSGLDDHRSVASNVTMNGGSMH